MLRPPRRMSDSEIEELLALEVPARVATLDRDAFPHVTPLWFVWSGGAFYMTSLYDRPHLRRLRRNPRAGLCVDVEHPARDDGERPNAQVRAIGEAELLPDAGGEWTRRITAKYVHGAIAGERGDWRAQEERIAIVLRPERLVAVASV